jgi:hypothetical protein
MMFKKSLTLLPLLALAAAGQDIPWQDFALGDRVEVTLLTGAPLSGRLAAPSPKVSSVDYTKESTLTIDLRGDIAGARGTITVSKKEIRSIRKLAPPGPGSPVVADESSAPSTDRINQEIRAKWGEATLTPASAADDAEYLRRACLDIVGVIPTLAETERFLSDSAPDRRAKLVDRLLEHPRYAAHWADIWALLLLGARSDPRDMLYQFQLRDDLKKLFERNLRYDEFAREVILAHGTVSQNPGQMMMAEADAPESSGLAVYVYRLFQDAQRDLPMALAGKLTRTFMGVQIQCAQCHDHPFDRWTQEDFYGMASFFTEVFPRREPVEGKTVPVPGMPDKTMPVYVFRVEDRPRTGRRGFGEMMGAGMDLVIPETKGKPVKPSFIGTGEGAGPGRSRRQEFARIMTSRDNLQFAKMAVNRYWAHFFGAGLVNPPDDFSGKNKPSHPELLDGLAKDFIDSGYDLHWLIRSIASSQAYGLSSRSKDRTPESLRLFSVARVRALSPEQLLASVLTATSDPQAGMGPMRREDERKRFLIGLMSQFRHAFDDDEGSEISEFAGSVPSALLMMNNEFLARGMRADVPGSRLGQILRSTGSPDQRIRAIFLTVLSRPPSAAEVSRWQGRVEASGGPAGYEDLMWTLLQTSEFLFNH